MLVFLGGSCDPTTWRTDVVIPILQSKNVEFYNPQVKDWHSGLVALEREAKKKADVLFFVIDSQTRAIGSIAEVAGYIGAHRNVVLVVNDVVDGTTIGGQVVTGSELKDLNRGRAYVRDLAHEFGVTVHTDIKVAAESIK